MVGISVAFEQNTIKLNGELTRQTLMQVSTKVVKFLSEQDSALVNLQQVSKVDTAGLAWLFYLLERAQKVSCQLHFANLPTKLDNLINLSGVKGFLPE
ncbi:MAG: STAS domain-containing protein [Colwellia sp.]|nr:STAS domain-containing protein [Colwellia sp.]MCW8864996.1 STAS domain-containing protein [Colwellia sp.]MCW9081748.1 STAS domain-containing protein [Colwellia sp.]